MTTERRFYDDLAIAVMECPGAATAAQDTLVRPASGAPR